MKAEQKKLPHELEQLLMEKCNEYGVDVEEMRAVIINSIKIIIAILSEILNQSK